MMHRLRKLHSIIYTIADFLTAMAAWTAFFLYRKWSVEGLPWLDFSVLVDIKFYVGVLLIPTGWVLFYAIFDQYGDIYRLSRLATFARTFFFSFLGVIFLFFTLILDDFVTGYTSYYKSFYTLFLWHFLLTVTVRIYILTRASQRLKAGLVSSNTPILGVHQN